MGYLFLIVMFFVGAVILALPVLGIIFLVQAVTRRKTVVTTNIYEYRDVSNLSE
jgi:hypothetical protein